jgi:hypothetical protein
MYCLQFHEQNVSMQRMCFLGLMHFCELDKTFSSMVSKQRNQQQCFKVKCLNPKAWQISAAANTVLPAAEWSVK